MPPPTASVESGASAGLRSVTIQIEGTLVLHDNFTAWPMTASGDGTGKFVDAFHFSRVGCGNTNDAKKDCSTGVDGKHCKKNGSVVQLKTRRRAEGDRR